MRNLVVFFVLIFFCYNSASSLPSLTELQSKEDHIRALDILADHFRTHYGLLDFKKDTLGVSLESLLIRYKKLITHGKPIDDFYKDKGAIDQLSDSSTESPMSAEDCRQLLIAFATEFNDGHVSVTKSTETGARLGLRVSYLENKAVVVYVDDDYISDKTCPVKKGDVLLSMDGRSTEEMISRLSLYIGLGNIDTNRNLAAHFLTSRPGDRFKVPTGVTTIEFAELSSPESVSYACTLPWIESDLEEFGDLYKSITSDVSTDLEKTASGVFYNLPGQSSFITEPFLNRLKNKGNVYEIAEESEHTSFIFNHEIQHAVGEYEIPYTLRLGYITIPSFSQSSEAIKWYSDTLKAMETKTDGLVIDIINNPGGGLKFLAEILKLFSSLKKPLKMPTFAMRLSDFNINGWLNEIKPGKDDSLGVLQNWRNLKKQLFDWQQERKLMSPQIPFILNALQADNGSYLLGAEDQPIYTKPILVLMNRGTGSCGDFFPAVLKDNGRATLFGEKTIGLGGPVLGVTLLPLSELHVRATIGLGQRSNGQHIENAGIDPDVSYEVKYADIKNDFENYIDKFLEVISTQTVKEKLKDVKKRKLLD